MKTLLSEHFDYLSDVVKLRRYDEAVSQVIRAGDVALDIGCGSGVLGLACLRAGASFVHAIEETSFLEVARRTLEDSGYVARASFHRGRAQHVTLEERVDVIVCDHVGYFGIDYGILGMVADATQRFLKPGGTLIPAELRLSVAAIDSENCRARVGDWRGNKIPADYHWAGDLAAQTKHAVTLEPDDLLSEPVMFATLVLGTENRSFLSWTLELVATRDGHLDGIAGWFDCRLAADVWMTNSPLASERLQRPQAFLPLSAPVPVTAGEVIRVTVMARPEEHMLGWVVALPASGQRWVHSTWNGQLINPADLLRANPARIAALNQRGRARRIILDYCDGVRSVGDVEQLVLKEHPDLFPSSAELSAFVARVLGGDVGA